MKSLILGRIIGAVLVLALTAVFLLEASQASIRRSYAAQASRFRAVASSINTYPPGIPAIAPSLPRSLTDPTQPTFTANDVRRYLGPQPYQTVDGTIPQVVKVVFIPASQASALLNGEWIGRPQSELVCFVEIHGNLSRAGMSVPARATQLLLGTSHVAYAVFDAYTGNLLLASLSLQ